ncbi:alpha/beta fold hydrolase [Streptomyces sp. NPDC005573]|uniref:alpha/beta fold hydrolase n=1 Tax=unclassified Streptomyces TaxID=2593676 RepID=UPI0033A263BD
MTGRTATPGADGPQAALVVRSAARPVRAAVLFLHGGKADSLAPARPWQLAALRMRPFVRSVSAAVPDGDVLVGEVRYRVRGWNDDAADPVQDTLRALGELARLAGDVPVVLVGHSMGGRAALRAAAAPEVRAVLALAPWCPDGEPVAHLQGKRVVVLHGDRDRITDPRASVSYVRRARDAGARADVSLLAGGDHAMLRHPAAWHRAADSTVAELLAATRAVV